MCERVGRQTRQQDKAWGRELTHVHIDRQNVFEMFLQIGALSAAGRRFDAMHKQNPHLVLTGPHFITRLGGLGHRPAPHLSVGHGLPPGSGGTPPSRHVHVRSRWKLRWISKTRVRVFEHVKK